MKKIACALTLMALGACSDRGADSLGRTTAGCLPESADAVIARNGWVRRQDNAAAMTAAYFTVVNCTAEPVTLTGVTTPAAAIVEMHGATRDANGVVSMTPAADLVVQPGQSLVFEPGGLHAMLMQLSGPVSAGDKPELTLQFGGRPAVTIEAEVRSAVDAAEGDADHAEH